MLQANYHWEKAPGELTIEPDIIHLWRLYIPAAIPDLEKFSECLAEEEQSRADRFRIPDARISFVIGRGVLRLLVGRYTQILPENVPIYCTSLGKPYLAEEKNPLTLSFNLSHSGQWVVLAFGRSRMIGIDIEQHKENVRFEEIAERFFAPRELDFLLKFEGERRMQIFYGLWVRKEACLKALGTGLSQSLQELHLPFAERNPSVFQLPGQSPLRETWWIYPFSVDPAYSCALVSCPPPLTLRRFHFQL